MNEKTLVIIGTLGCIILGVIASLIAWFCGGQALSGKGKDIIKEMFNFQLSLVVVCIILALIPYVGALLCAVLSLVSVVYSVLAFIAYTNNKEFTAPKFPFINIQ